MMTITDQREQAVWLGDVVTIGTGKTHWTVARGSCDLVTLKSVRGAWRRVMRSRVQLVERCPDGPQLEMWDDGRGYLGDELVYSSDNMTHAVLRWDDDREDWAQSVTLSVCTNRQLEVQSGGTTEGSAMLNKAEVLDLATALFAMARHVSE